MAFISETMRDTLRRATEGSAKVTTAIISGRSREKVEAFVQLDGIVYAGSHGFDIQAPADPTEGGGGGAEGADDADNDAATRTTKKKKPMSLSVGDAFRPMLEEVRRELEEDLASVVGAMVEDNKFALSVHYRNVVDEVVATAGPSPECGPGDGNGGKTKEAAAAAAAPPPPPPSGKGGGSDVVFPPGLIPPEGAGPGVVGCFAAAGAQVAKRNDQLVCRHGKKVLELRPKLEWHKGSALLWILDALGFMRSMPPPSAAANAVNPTGAAPKGGENKGAGSQGSGGQGGGDKDGGLLGADVCPFYIGDDITDEDAFYALAALRAPPGSDGDDVGGEGGGVATGGGDAAADCGDGNGCNGNGTGGGVGVLVRRVGDPERTAASFASFRVQDPDEVALLIDCIAAEAKAYDARQKQQHKRHAASSS